MSRIVDLSYPIEPHWRHTFFNELIVHENFEYKEGDYGRYWHDAYIHINSHAFTHLDAPLHFTPGAKSLDQMPLETWAGRAVIVDLSYKKDDEGITAEDLEKQGQKIQRGDIAIMMTRFDERCSIKERRFWQHFPYMERSACEWLVGRGIKAYGVDFPPDYSTRYFVSEKPERAIPDQEEFTTHFAFLPREIGIIEYLCNLGALRRDVVQLYALPLKIIGLDGCPARVIAVED
ncbi:MAG TPA: cyclase family protein [Methylomirabilota bacterium]|jgi:arylformamidase|nr:cyclase family protein [Methylomirabilota bacterium]